MKPTNHRTPYLDDHHFTCERITRGDLAGAYHCSGTRDGHGVWMNYLWYTHREAIARFKAHLVDTYGRNTI